MSDIFKIVVSDLTTQGEKDISVGIDLRIGDRELPCRFTKTCRSFEELSVEVKAIQRDLDRILKEAMGYFKSRAQEEGPEVNPDMSAEEIWSAISQIKQENQITDLFNSLDETKRKEVAEYILTHCNVFSGVGAFFSRCYNRTSGLIE